MRTAHTVTIDVHVNDPKALWAAAQAKCMDKWMNTQSIKDFIGTRRTPNVPGCLRAMFDPGQSPAGCEIQDSTADEGFGLD